LLQDILAARLAGRFTTEQLALAYRQGDASLKALLDESRKTLLAPLVTDWLKASRVKNKTDYRRQVISFVVHCGGESTATIADLRIQRIASWLDAMTDGRRARAGARVRSGNPEVVEQRLSRRRKSLARPPRAVSDATRNRHRTALQAFCSYLVVTGVLTTNPISKKRLPAKEEAQGRMPDVSSTEWSAYLSQIKADPAAPPASALVAKLLRHLGADVGEVIGYWRRSDRGWVPGFAVLDIEAVRHVPRIRFKRQKIKRSMERLVPFTKDLMRELEAHIEFYKLGRTDRVFRMTDRREFERAHTRACRAIGREDLRLKDFRHLAAIAWARGGARLEQIKEWLGHSDIRMTEIYARFAPDDAFDAPTVERAAAYANAGAAAAIGSIAKHVPRAAS